MQKVVNSLKNAFGDNVKVEGKTAKIHVKEIDLFGIKRLGNFGAERFKNTVKDVLLKRSSSGITIIVTVK